MNFKRQYSNKSDKLQNFYDKRCDDLLLFIEKKNQIYLPDLNLK